MRTILIILFLIFAFQLSFGQVKEEKKFVPKNDTITITLNKIRQEKINAALEAFQKLKLDLWEQELNGSFRAQDVIVVKELSLYSFKIVPKK